MAPHPLVEVDPAALAIAYLSTHPDVTAALGGAGGRIAGVNRPPYPRVSVSDPPGSTSDLRWLVTLPLQIEVLGDLDGTPGKATLRHVAMTVVGALWQWQDADFGPDDPVVNAVRIPLPGWQPLATGQPRYLATPYITVHPPAHR